ncbi:MAG: formate dehydrogenase accessory sulfurtransferase FdhD [Solidesulfovibrio sp.]
MHACQLQASQPDENQFDILDGVDQYGEAMRRCVVVENPLTIYLNSTEVYTTMTIGNEHHLLAIGCLLNRRLLTDDDRIDSIEYDPRFATVVVKTCPHKVVDGKTLRRIHASGCGMGELYYDAMGLIDSVGLDTSLRVSSSAILGIDKAVRSLPSVHSRTGAIHGCALLDGDGVIVHMEDVERHNAMDKVSGFMYVNKISPLGKILYTTGRLTSEMVIKTVLMGISILVSTSGFTGWGVELARHADLTLIGYAQGAGFQVVSGQYRVMFDLPRGNGLALSAVAGEFGAKGI